MIHDEVIEMMDKKISWLSYQQDPSSRQKLKIINLDRELYILTKDFTIHDWSNIHTDKHFAHRDSIRGSFAAETDYLRKKYLLDCVFNYK